MATAHHGFPVPAPTDPMKPRLDIEALAQAIDTALPKITKGTGAPPTTGVRDGDIHLQYIPAVVAQADAPAPAPPVEAAVATPKKAQSRKAATG